MHLDLTDDQREILATLQARELHTLSLIKFMPVEQDQFNIRRAIKCHCVLEFLAYLQEYDDLLDAQQEAEKQALLSADPPSEHF